jgi:hypothetical protein
MTEIKIFFIKYLNLILEEEKLYTKLTFINII